MRFTIFTVELDPETGFVGRKENVGTCYGPDEGECKVALSRVLRATFTMAFELVATDDGLNDEPDLAMCYGTSYTRCIGSHMEAARLYRGHFARKGVR